MHPATRSVFVFGIYLLLSGVMMAVRPDMTVANMGLPAGAEVSLRPLGAVIGIFGLYFLAAARQQVVPFFAFTVWGRMVAVASLVVFVAMGLLPAGFLGIAAIDLAGALWTWARMRTPAPAVRTVSV